MMQTGRLIQRHRAGKSARSKARTTPPFKPLLWLTTGLLAACLSFFALLTQALAVDIPQRLIDNHRATMGCWLANIDDDELSDKAIFIDLGAQKLYGFICTTSLTGDSYRLFLVEGGRDEWANLVSFPQLDTKLGWYATSQLQKPTWDEKNKLLRAESPKQGSTSSCRQFSIYRWQKSHFHIAQIGLAGDCKEKDDKEKDLIIYPFVEEVEKGKASGLAPTDAKTETADKEEKKSE